MLRLFFVVLFGGQLCFGGCEATGQMMLDA